LAFGQVLRVRDIMVVGNRNLLPEEVITQSGVKMGDSLLSITSGLLEENLEKNRYIEYVAHSFDYKGRLTITIRERLGRAVVNILGLYYVLDETGMVLECAGSSYPTGVSGPYVVGITMGSNTQATVGQKLPVRDETQLLAMQKVLTELEHTDMLVGASELSIKNLDNLYYTTRDGVKVELGDDKELYIKLQIAREVLSLREPMGDLVGSKIDVSAGDSAHYIPAVLPTVTPVPTDRPMKKLTIRLVREPVAPTAATDTLPQKRPTITRSAALKNSCSRLVRMMGMV